MITGVDSLHVVAVQPCAARNRHVPENGTKHSVAHLSQPASCPSTATKQAVAPAGVTRREAR